MSIVNKKRTNTKVRSSGEWRVTSGAIPDLGQDIVPGTPSGLKT